MGQVYNSVQQIVEECNKLIDFTEECEYQDVNLLASSLKEKSKNLKELFDSNPEKEKEINTLKVEVEELAIRLEYYVAQRLNEMVGRYRLREEAGAIYEYCKQRVLTLKNASEKEVLDWSIYSRWAMNYFARSLHVLFLVEEEDKDILNAIRKMMREEK